MKKIKRYELEIKPIDNLADKGFSGMLKVYDKNGKVTRRKGFNGATEEMVKN